MSEGFNDDFDDKDDEKEYDEFIERIRKKFNIDSDVFDAEFYIFPSSGLGKRFGLEPDDKGFKISYHYEKGMDKPEINIDGKFDKDKLEDYFKRMKFIKSNNPNIDNLKDMKKLFRAQRNEKERKQEIDAEELKLQKPLGEEEEKKEITEPQCEIIDSGDGIEIIMECPGIKENNIFISLDDENKILNFNAENKNKKYEKKVQLPCSMAMKNETLEVNNGIVFFKCKKK
jgi:HSP20 family molecular chaperone IbpA